MSKTVDLEVLEDVKTITILNSEFNMYGPVDKPLFLAHDVAELIEYSTDKVGQMLDLVDDDEKLTDTIYRGGQSRDMWFLTEDGLYELLMQSRKPLAKKFKAEIKKMLKIIRSGGLQANRAMVERGGNLVIENAKILFRNFSGEETKFNRAGDRNFCVIIDDDKQAEKLLDDGWNIKQLQPRDDGDTPKHYVNVTVRFDNFPPKIFLVTKRKKTLLDETTVNTLDFADIYNVDLTINPSKWETNGKTGVKAYLKTMYATIEEDEFSEKYADIDDGDQPF